MAEKGAEARALQLSVKELGAFHRSVSRVGG